MKHVSFVVFPGFPMLAYALAREALDIANRLSPSPVFSCDTRIPGHRPEAASNGAVMAPDRTDWDGVAGIDLALVICGDALPARIPNGFQSFLARVDEAGGRLGGVAGGTLILARLGRLDGRRAVVQRAQDETEFFAAIDLCDRPFHLEDRRLTATGGVAVSDALCAWIATVTTPALAQEVARALATGRMPNLPDALPAEEQQAEATLDPVIAAMDAQMRANLASPLQLSDLAESLGLSRKALRGRCERALGIKPSDHYLALRLRHGAELLRHTAMPISEIARASGFDTLAGFSRAISNAMGVSPSAVRKMARAARMVSSYG